MPIVKGSVTAPGTIEKVEEEVVALRGRAEAHDAGGTA